MENEIEIYGPESPDLQEGDRVLYLGHWETIHEYDGTSMPYRLQGESWCSREDLYGCQVRRAKPKIEPVEQIKAGSSWVGKEGRIFEGYEAKLLGGANHAVLFTVPGIVEDFGASREAFLSEFELIEEPKPKPEPEHEVCKPTHLEAGGKIYPITEIRLLKEVK